MVFSSLQFILVLWLDSISDYTFRKIVDRKAVEQTQTVWSCLYDIFDPAYLDGICCK